MVNSIGNHPHEKVVDLTDHLTKSVFIIFCFNSFIILFFFASVLSCMFKKIDDVLMRHAESKLIQAVTI